MDNNNIDNRNNDKDNNNIKKSKTPIIVGFDPGLTVGIAILDLNGDLVYLNSFKEIAKSDIINIIMEHGNAVLIATDVEQVPKAVKKLASSLNAKTFSPKNDVPVSYKQEIVTNFLNNAGEFNFKNGNDNNSIGTNFHSSNSYVSSSSSSSVDAHGRDSLAAAIIAYNNYKKKLNQLERKFLEAKMDLNSIDKEDFINENFYEILNQAKSLLILDNPISEAISIVFKNYGIIDDESSVEDNNSKNNINNINNINNSFNDNSVGEANNQNQTNQNQINLLNNSNSSHSENSLFSDSDAGLVDDLDNDDIISMEEIVALEGKITKLKNINKSQEKLLKNQNKLIEDLKNKNKSSLENIDKKDEKIAKLEKELKELNLKESKAILKDKELASKIQLLKNIQNKYKEEKELRESLEEKLNKRLVLDDFDELSMFTPIKIIDSFTKSGLSEANNTFKLKKDDVIYLKSLKGGGSQTAKFIVDLGIKAIIKGTNNESFPSQAEEVFETEGVAILDENDLDIKFFDDYAVADSKELDGKLVNWSKKQEEKTTKKAEDNLLNVINEYRVERKREL